MVEIRTLKPLVKLRLPSKPEQYKRTNVVVVRRTQVTHPSPTPQPTPCRLWQGASGSDGYGWRKYVDHRGDRKPISMHRWVMSMALQRPLLPSEIVLHACDNPFCYRLDHLSLGTVQDNNADMRRKGRDSAPPVNVFKGEAHPMAKLTELKVAQIRHGYRTGLKAVTLADDYGVSVSTIRRIVKGLTWADTSTRDLLAEAREKKEP